MKKEERRWAKKTKWMNLRAVFGHPFSLLWFSPFSTPDHGKAETYQYVVWKERTRPRLIGPIRAPLKPLWRTVVTADTFTSALRAYSMLNTCLRLTIKHCSFVTRFAFTVIFFFSKLLLLKGNLMIKQIIVWQQSSHWSVTEELLLILIYSLQNWNWIASAFNRDLFKALRCAQKEGSGITSGGRILKIKPFSPKRKHALVHVGPTFPPPPVYCLCMLVLNPRFHCMAFLLLGDDLIFSNSCVTFLCLLCSGRIESGLYFCAFSYIALPLTPQQYTRWMVSHLHLGPLVRINALCVVWMTHFIIFIFFFHTYHLTKGCPVKKTYV